MYLRRSFAASPLLARVAPFVIFLILTAAQGQFGESSRYWFYLAKTLVGAWLVWEMRRWVPEMRWALSWEAVAVGAGVFVLWVGLDPFYPKPGALLARVGLGQWAGADATPWNPLAQFGGHSARAWLMIGTRLAGSSLVVPPLEEVFFRSFLYRYLARPDFLSVPLGKFFVWPFIATALVFGLEHQQWLAGILCGAAYQCLVIRKNRLGDAMTAHAITNFLLGVWIVWKGAWNFW